MGIRYEIRSIKISIDSVLLLTANRVLPFGFSPKNRINLIAFPGTHSFLIKHFKFLSRVSARVSPASYLLHHESRENAW